MCTEGVKRRVGFWDLVQISSAHQIPAWECNRGAMHFGEGCWNSRTQDSGELLDAIKGFEVDKNSISDFEGRKKKLFLGGTRMKKKILDTKSI
ncbi:hypothetical protein V6N11_077302 [Hibiscus sabdariffa]|uniref:Uncharacterized protein n=1 Tax=Hibiscus sabdariffa TaxID=183260 RepID=A0ABR2TD96_9ROSI